MPTEGTISFESFASRRSKVLAEHQDWFTCRTVESDDGAVFRLPTEHEVGLRALYGLDTTEWRAELALARDCAPLHAIGIQDGSFVRYRYLADAIAPATREIISKLRNIGWDDQYIQRLSGIPQIADGIGVRLKAAAGRLISMPEYLSHRDILRDAWVRLANTSRPEFPLHRSPRLPSCPDGFTRVSKRTKLARFLTDFDEFCDRWALDGLATWHLPMPDGPHWPVPALPSPISRNEGEATVRTPWHFSVRADDGLGDLLRNEHRKLLQDHGIDDEAHYESYGHLLLIDHWERVLTQRYKDRPRPTGFVTQMIGVVSSIAGLDSERVAKLRKALRSLQTGSRKSLKKFR